MKFDWYQATCAARPEDVAQVLSHAFPSSEWRPGRACNGYERGYECASGILVHATMQYGGSAMGEGVHVTATGENAPAASVALRRGIKHVVTRADAAADFDGGEGTWEKLFNIGVAVVEEFGLKSCHMGDYLTGLAGRTLYIGAPSSVVRARIYEKGKQLQIKDRQNWVRVELAAKPKGEARTRASTLAPASLYGFSRWSKMLGHCIGQVDIERFQAGTIRRPDDDERAYRTMVKQYRKVLGRRMEDHGSWAALGMQLGHDIALLSDDEQVT